MPLAEREGFEPPVPFSTSVFKTDAIDHSAIFPSLALTLARLRASRLYSATCCATLLARTIVALAVLARVNRLKR